jgi:hypothetical protein
LNLFNQGWLASSLIEIGLQVLEKKIEKKIGVVLFLLHVLSPLVQECRHSFKQF